LCGQTIGQELAYLDHEASNKDPETLAWLCNHHHWTYDVGLFSLAALKVQRALTEDMKGKRTNAFMKDAEKKIAVTRAANAAAKLRSEVARRGCCDPYSQCPEGWKCAAPQLVCAEHDQAPTVSRRG